MDSFPFVPDSSALRVDQVSVADGEAVIFAHSVRPVGHCPQCGRPAARVHSRYQRTLQDLSWQGTQVTIRWRSRKFFCDTPGCPQRIFTEQIPTITWRSGRRTVRARDVLECLGVVLGGEGGRRVARQLCMPVSGDTILRAVRRMVFPAQSEPHVIGVDDWALRRGQHYGTIIVDLERHRPLELLPDRNFETLRDWLTAHPSVEVVSRDRADCYAHGALAGAPQAMQVADRWHLLNNLREALQHAAERFMTEIQLATKKLNAAGEPEMPPVAPPSESHSPHGLQNENTGSLREIRRSRRRERYERVKQLHAQGMTVRAIARVMKLSRKTVTRFLHAEQFPERAARPPSGSVVPFLDDLRRLWNSGCHNARTLTKELRGLGYRGSYFSVRRAVYRWRCLPQNDHANSVHPKHGAVRRLDVPSARHVAWLLFLDSQELEPHEHAMSQALQEECPPLRVAANLARDFVTLIKQRRADEVPNWIERASAEHVPIDLRRFAQGLLPDLAAIQAAATLPWSNGQTEGQINRLKLTKRTMYGRANLDLLRLRFLLGAGLA